MVDTDKLRALGVIAHVLGVVAVFLAVLRFNGYVSDALVSMPEAVLGVVVGSATLLLGRLALKFVGDFDKR